MLSHKPLISPRLSAYNVQKSNRAGPFFVGVPLTECKLVRARLVHRANARTFAGQVKYKEEICIVYLYCPRKLASHLNQRKARYLRHRYHLFVGRHCEEQKGFLFGHSLTEMYVEALSIFIHLLIDSFIKVDRHLQCYLGAANLPERLPRSGHLTFD